jgi:hypothetical protein
MLVAPKAGKESTGDAYLNTEVTTVNVVTQKQVSGLGRVSANLEQLHQIVILSVDVTAYGDGGIHFQKIGLRPEDIGTGFDDP